MTLTISAPAKLNLGLEVLGRRPDGYHEIVTVMVKLELADELSFAPDSAINVEIVADGAVDPATLPSHEDDLIAKAAHCLQRAMGVSSGARIHCRKRIPVAAGLGGASSDAASTLAGLQRLWGGRVDREAMVHVAASLGSDVPFFLAGGLAALATDRGEQLHFLPAPQPTWVVLAAPRHHLPHKTATMYRHLLPSDFSDGSATFSLARMLRQGEPLTGLPVFNVFEAVLARSFPELAQQLRAAREVAGCQFNLTGAGPSFYSLHRTLEEASHCQMRLQRIGLPGVITRTASGPLA